MSNIFIGLKKTCLGVLDRKDRDKDNETGLKERGALEMSTTSIRSIRFAFVFVLTYLALDRHRLFLIPNVFVNIHAQIYVADVASVAKTRRRRRRKTSCRTTKLNSTTLDTKTSSYQCHQCVLADQHATNFQWTKSNAIQIFGRRPTTILNRDTTAV